jgi:hypothetical protein
LRTVYDEHVAGMYVTRIEFIDFKQEYKKIMKEYIAWFLSKREGRR